MTNELYNRIHPHLREKMPLFKELLSENLITRENIAGIREPGYRAALAALEAEKAKPDSLFDKVDVWEETVPSYFEGEPDVRVIIMRPKGAKEPLPGVLGIHGGGMILSCPEDEQLKYMEFAIKVNCVVVSPDYRLAPENPYPAGFHDCCSALEWFHANAERLGADADRMGIAGTSAGGLMSTATALWARDEGRINIKAVYAGSPMLDHRNITSSAKEIDEVTFLWSGPQNVLAWEMYLNGLDPVTPYASPSLEENLEGMPPFIILCGELDPFRDETIDFAARLYRAKVPADLHIFPGHFHGSDLIAAGCEMELRMRDMMHKGMYNLLHHGYF